MINVLFVNTILCFQILTQLAIIMLANWCVCIDENPKVTYAVKVCIGMCKKKYFKCLAKRACQESVKERIPRCYGYLERCRATCREAARLIELYGIKL